MLTTKRLTALVAVLSLAGGLPVPAHAAAAFVAISGAGSSWSANAVDQWRANVNQYGMTINYSSTGSSDGRTQFRNGTVDFAVSEIPYGLNDQGTQDPAPPAGDYAYMPIVAGGTAFMYNLKIGTKRVTNLRLSGDVIVKIFTGKIAKWDDPAIAADNPSLTLPAKKIVPVVRSDGSGTTAQFTTWMSKQHPSLWDDYCRQRGKPTPCGFTSYYPTPDPPGAFVSATGSIGVASYVKQAQSEGAITYVEYSYAVENKFPVAKVRNKNSYYVEPTAENVSVALLDAKINTDLTQDLSKVYSSDDNRSYPLSSYSYMIIPLKLKGSFNTAKGQTLAAFANYFLCEGQQRVSYIGYSPLPKNLVQAGFQQVAKIPGAVAKNVDISKCNNPTFSAKDGTNVLARNAPQPPACDKVGPTQCATGTGGTVPRPTAPPTAAPSAVPTGTATPGPGATGTPQVDPDTGLPVGEGAGGGDGDVAGVPVALPADTGWDQTNTLMLIAIILLIGIILGPPLIGRTLATRGVRGGQPMNRGPSVPGGSPVHGGPPVQDRAPTDRPDDSGVDRRFPS